MVWLEILAPFYEIDLTSDIYEKELKKLDIGFVNHAPEACSTYLIFENRYRR